MKYKYNSRLLRIISSSLIVGMTSICSPRILSMDLLNQQLSENSAVESINLALFDIAKSLNEIKSDCYQMYLVNGEGIVDICYILNQMLEIPSKETFCLQKVELENINTDKITHQDIKTSLEDIKVKLSNIKNYAQFINNFENVETLFPQLKIAKQVADKLLFFESPHTMLLSITTLQSDLYMALKEANKCSPDINLIKEKIFSKYVYSYSSYLKTLSYEDLLNISQSYGKCVFEQFISMCLYSYQEICGLESFAQIQMNNDGRLVLTRIDLVKRALESILGNESLKTLIDIEEIKNRRSQLQMLSNLKKLSSWYSPEDSKRIHK